ncbi:MAG: serine/threonine-protein kinase [Verrucomicrobiales bacterium]
MHRDIKPANILCDRSSLAVWVCDFGIARTADDPALTYGGMLAGTPNYMSPEQAEGKAVDGRSDLFSLGAVLYQCVAGEPPFKGETTPGVLHNILHSEPRATNAIAPKLPVWFHRLILNLLAKDPRDRFRDARAVLRSIDEQWAPRPRRIRRRRRWQAVAAGSLAALAGIGWALLQIPAVAYRANLAIAGLTDRDIVNAERFGAHESLAEAVAHAQPGDVLEFASEGPFRIDQTDIPAGKPLTLRSGKAGVARLEVHEAAKPGITTRSPLKLERLSFAILSPRDRGHGILRVIGCRTEIDHCLFAARYQPPQRWTVAVQAVVETHGACDLRITDTIFRVDDAKPIQIGGVLVPDPGGQPTKLSLENCFFDGLYSIHATVNHPAQIEVSMRRTLCTGDVTIWHPERVPLPDKFTLRVRDSIFSPDRTLIWFPGIPVEMIRSTLDWDGENNLYRETRDLIHNTPEARFRPNYRGPVTNLEEFRAFANHPLPRSEEQIFPSRR